MDGAPFRKVLARQAGVVVGLAGLAFVLWTLFDDRELIVDALASSDVRLLLPAYGAGLVGMVAIAYAWNRCLAALGSPRPVVDTWYRYFMGELGKYVPGGVWSLVGRGELLQRVGVHRRVVYTSIGIGLVTTYAAALVVALLALVTGGGGGDVQLWWFPAGIVAGGVMLHPAVISWVLAGVGRLLRREVDVDVPSWGQSAALVAWNLPAWLGIGVATWLIARAVDSGGADLANIVFATSVAWFVGFVAVPVPGGIGVREAVFLAAATSLSTSGVAAAVAVAARLLFIVVDTSAAIGFALLSRMMSPVGQDDEVPSA